MAEKCIHNHGSGGPRSIWPKLGFQDNEYILSVESRLRCPLAVALNMSLCQQMISTADCSLCGFNLRVFWVPVVAVPLKSKADAFCAVKEILA